MEASTNTQIQLASTADFDQVEIFFSGSVEPDLTLGGDLNVELPGGFQLAAGQTLLIIEYDTFGSVSGAFANAAAGDVVLTNNGFDLVVSYDLVGNIGGVFLQTEIAGGGNPPPNDDWPNGTISKCIDRGAINDL